MKKTKKINKLLENNTFLINTSICIVILLLMFYFGITGNTKKTYSASVNGQCAVGYSLHERKKDNGYVQYCCPSGTTFYEGAENGYCVVSGYDFIDLGSEICFKSFDYSSNPDKVHYKAYHKENFNICTSENHAGLADGWFPNHVFAERKGDYYTVTGLQCYNEDTSVCLKKAETPTYTNGACFKKIDGTTFYGNEYFWTNTYEDGMALVKDYTTANACAAANQEAKKCYVNETIDERKGPKYKWLSTSLEGTANNGGWYEDSSYTTAKSCLSNNRYVIEYEADSRDTGVTNLPGTQYKYHYDTIELSSRVPVRDGYKFLYWKGESSTQKYSPGDYYTLESSVSFTAVWEEIMIKDIKSYEFAGKTIKKVPANTLVSDFKSNITLGSSYSMDVESKSVNNKDVLFTGALLTIKKGTTEKDWYAVVVNGDTDGDGELHPIEFVYIHNHFKAQNEGKKDGLLEDLYLVAADFDNDGSVHPKDYVELHNYLKSQG